MQSSFIYRPPSHPSLLIALFDQWTPEHPDQARHAWLPVEMQDDRFQIRWRDEWRLP